MSNVFSSGRGVTAAELILFIMVILVSGVTAYIFYTHIDDLNAKIAKADTDLEDARKELTGATKTRDDLYAAVGYGSLDQIRSAFAVSSIKAEPQTLEKLIQAKFAKRDEQIKSIGVDPKPDDAGQSKFLQETIVTARQAGAVPDTLKNTKVGDLVAQLIRLDKALASRADEITRGEAALAAADQKIADKKTETNQKFAEMDQKAAQAWDDRVVEDNKLRVEPPKWDAEGRTLEQALALEQSVKAKLDLKVKTQKDMATPIDGKILTFDWQSGRGTVDLGARDNVKPGYEFDVFSTRPGPDRPDKRIYHARVRLLDVDTESSLFVRIRSQYDDVNKPVIVSDLVCSQVYDESHPKTFVVKGWFPRGADYSKDSIAGIVVKDGGVVQRELSLDTDYLVIGVIDEKGLSDPGAEAKAAIAEGAKAFEEARHTYVTVLTVEKFFRYMNRSGFNASP
jgi:hypothetical protein